MGYRLIAYAAVGAHFAFLAFGLFGGYLAWRWPRLVWWHAAGAAWMVLVVVASLECPLTWIEDRARERAGMAGKPGGFLANYAEGVFYPADHRVAAMAVAGVIVLASWIGFAVGQRRRHGRRGPHRAGLVGRLRRRAAPPPGHGRPALDGKSENPPRCAADGHGHPGVTV